VAEHQLTVRHYRYLWIPEGLVLLLQIVVDIEASASPLSALELAGDGG
jgi:hypothetical protein